MYTYVLINLLVLPYVCPSSFIALTFLRKNSPIKVAVVARFGQRIFGQRFLKNLFFYTLYNFDENATRTTMKEKILLYHSFC